jgi:molecular chaperone HscB
MASPLACASCHCLYPEAESLDHFKVFGLPPAYDVDEEALRRKFLAISRSVHPDYFGGASDAMRTMSLRLSSEVNQAYRVLKDPFLRAEYLLEMAGGKSSAEDKTVPPSLLNEVFLLQEEIEEAKAGGDQTKLEPLKRDLTVRQNGVVEQIRALMGSLESDATKDEVRKQLNGLKYISNLIEQI